MTEGRAGDCSAFCGERLSISLSCEKAYVAYQRITKERKARGDSTDHLDLAPLMVWRAGVGPEREGAVELNVPPVGRDYVDLEGLA